MFSFLKECIENDTTTIDHLSQFCANDDERRELWKIIIRKNLRYIKYFPVKLETPDFWDYLKNYVNPSLGDCGINYVPVIYISYDDYVNLIKKYPQSIFYINSHYKNSIELCEISLLSLKELNINDVEKIFKLQCVCISKNEHLKFCKKIIEEIDEKNVPKIVYGISTWSFSLISEPMFDEIFTIALNRNIDSIKYMEKTNYFNRHPDMIQYVTSPKYIEYLPTNIIYNNKIFYEKYLDYINYYNDTLLESKYFKRELIEKNILSINNDDPTTYKFISLSSKIRKIIPYEYEFILKFTYKCEVICPQKNILKLFLPENNVKTDSDVLFDTYEIISKFI